MMKDKLLNQNDTIKPEYVNGLWPMDTQSFTYFITNCGEPLQYKMPLITPMNP